MRDILSLLLYYIWYKSVNTISPAHNHGEEITQRYKCQEVESMRGSILKAAYPTGKLKSQKILWINFFFLKIGESQYSIARSVKT